MNESDVIKIAEKGQYKDAYIAYLEDYIQKWSYGQLHTDVYNFTHAVQHGGWEGYIETSEGIMFSPNIGH